MDEKKVLLITGASSGIGRATARLMSGERRLVLAGRRVEPLEELSAELGGPDHALVVGCDVGEWDQVETMTSAALEAFGRIDEVFANAGFGATRGFLEESPEHWKSMVLTNVLGAALTIRSTLPHLLERGTGHYLITSSIAGRRVLPGSLYSASKFAATAIGEALRQELRNSEDGRKIKVTLIEPGMVDTDFFENRPGDSALSDEDIARTIEFALDQPPGVDINEILVRPITQSL
ncbi:MAG: SDR family oxidoreductase [Solirubrobacterales bacterium]|nr:SDR family oxidoreductase [Solirubrobacterales bacterium]